MAYVTSSYDAAGLNWNEYYEMSFKPGPYSLFLLIVNLFSSILTIEIAGKAFLSFVVGLTAILVFVWNREHSEEEPAWSLLLLFPFLFSQVYYMGFTNYLISIPILFLGLLVHGKIMQQRITFMTTILYILLLALLFLSHPYTILVYIVLATSITFLNLQSKRRLASGLLIPLMVAAGFGSWYASTFEITASSFTNAMQIRWWPMQSVLAYLCLPFVGMQFTDGPDIIVLVLWSITALLFINAGLKEEGLTVHQRQQLRLLLLSLAGFLLLPFWLGDYSYFNLRMSMVCYFLFAIFLGHLKLSPLSSNVFTILVALIMVMIIHKQMVLSAEREELLPILKQMKENARVYPIYEDAGSKELDKSFYYEFHAHNHFFYHIIVGGGATPTIFPSKMNPIRLKDPLALPNIALSAKPYDYILVRGELKEDHPFSKTHQFRSESGSWKLYERRSLPM